MDLEEHLRRVHANSARSFKNRGIDRSHSGEGIENERWTRKDGQREQRRLEAEAKQRVEEKDQGERGNDTERGDHAHGGGPSALPPGEEDSERDEDRGGDDERNETELDMGPGEVQDLVGPIAVKLQDFPDLSLIHISEPTRP